MKLFFSNRKKKEKLAETIDFSNYSLSEKKDVTKILLVKQVDLAKFMVDYYQGNNPFLNLNLMFLIMIKHSSFYDVLANKIPNQILTEDEFAILFAGELDNYVASYHYIILMVVLKKRSVSKKKMASLQSPISSTHQPALAVLFRGDNTHLTTRF